LTSFKLEQTTDLDFRYVYTCAETNDGASQAEKTTEWSALKQEKAESGVLEQLEVQCPYGETEYDWFVAALQLDLNWKTEVTGEAGIQCSMIVAVSPHQLHVSIHGDICKRHF
jgi:hypothetical protein